MSEYGKHYSVLLRECLDFFEKQVVALNPAKNLLIADLTFGAGGHSIALANCISNSKILAFDQDFEAIENGRKIINELNLNNRITLVHANFENFPKWVRDEMPQQSFDLILMDLGVSSHQFDSFERGFSFRGEGHLDMRMNSQDDQILTAEQIVNQTKEEDLANIIFKYGEERYSRKIARKIVEKRSQSLIRTTKDLEDIIFHVYPPKERYGKTHPATRTFQALRIYINRELEVLENTLVGLYDLLSDGGILEVITFHSLEDRIAKHIFKEISQRTPKNAKILTKKPVLPQDDEISENSRSRSAKLRVIQKIDYKMDFNNESGKSWKKIKNTNSVY